MDFPFRTGLKLYSTNTDLIPEAILLKNKYLDFVELYIIPGSYDKTINSWKEFDVPFVIHAPHTGHNVNIANNEMRKFNIEIYQEVRCFCDALKSPHIIVHGGSNGILEEMIFQLKMIGDDRIILENKPMKGLNGESCQGCSPEDFNIVFASGALHAMALDFGHAIYYAACCNLDYREVIESFMSFSPQIFHLSDGYYDSYTDVHLNLGKGKFNIKELLNYVPKGSKLTIETPRVSHNNLNEFAEDVHHLQGLVAYNYPS